MHRSLLLLALAAAAIVNVHATLDGCTAIIVGRKATVDGSLFTTHNNDCTNCDVRVGLIPSQKHNENAKRPIYEGRQDYPRYIGYDRGDVYLPERLDASVLKHDNASTEFNNQRYLQTKPFVPIGHIPEVKFTASYLDGNYAMGNEHGLMMGESTCAAHLVAYPPPLGDALWEIGGLSRLASERCATARCAIRTMGETAELHGYYGSYDPALTGENLYGEAGEALTIIDREEAWIFHILPDDTGRSAVWIAQRVPDDHFAVVANKFIITEFDLDDEENFMGSNNIYEVGKRTGLWSEEDQKKGYFNFRDVYSPEGLQFAHPTTMWDRRQWQLFRLVAPSLNLPAASTEAYPFSVKPDRPISLEDMFRFNRDNFDGSEFDLYKGPAAGPYGNPVRYDGNGQPYTRGGYFERAVSLHRTAYSTVLQVRPWMPPVASGIVWFGQHAPHSSTFAPLYSAMTKMPESYATGSIYKYSRESSWWAFASVQNYAEKMYSVISVEIKSEQRAVESEAQEKVKQMDTRVRKLLNDKGYNEKDVPNHASGAAWAPSDAENAAKEVLTEFSVEFGEQLTARWWALFEHILTKFRDGFIMKAFHPPSSLQPVFYPAWWLGMVGYYSNGPAAPLMGTHTKQPVPPHPENTNVVPGDAARVRGEPTAAGYPGVKPKAEPQQLAHEQVTAALSEARGMPAAAASLSEKPTADAAVEPATTAPCAAAAPGNSPVLVAMLVFAVAGVSYLFGRWHMRKSLMNSMSYEYQGVSALDE